MTEEILKSGFFFDEYYVLRVLEPGTASETVDLTDECSGYAESKLFHLHTVHNNKYVSRRTQRVPRYFTTFPGDYRLNRNQSRCGQNAGYRCPHSPEGESKSTRDRAKGVTGDDNEVE